MVIDALTTITEVAIGIAGFAAIFIAIGKDEVTIGSKGVFIQLWVQSVGIIIFSLLPMILYSYGLGDTQVFVFSSYTYLVFTSIVIPIVIFVRVRHFDMELTWTLLPIAASIPLISLVNAVFVQQPWLYLVALVVAILLAFQAFMLLVFSMWRSDT